MIAGSLRAGAFVRAAALGVAAGLVAGWGSIGACQTLGDARAFTLKLYEAYEHGEPDYLGPLRDQVFTARLLRLIRRDQQLTPKGDVGALDGDPICDCQDPGSLSNVRVSVRPTGPRRARASVAFDLDGARSAALDLVAEKGAWRVDDVHTSDTPSLAGLLRDAHPESAGIRPRT